MFRTGKHLQVKISFVYREHRTAKMFWLYFAIPFFFWLHWALFFTYSKILKYFNKGVSTGCQTVSPQSSYRILLGHRNTNKAKGKVTTKLCTTDLSFQWASLLSISCINLLCRAVSRSCSPSSSSYSLWSILYLSLEEQQEKWAWSVEFK